MKTVSALLIMDQQDMYFVSYAWKYLTGTQYKFTIVVLMRANQMKVFTSNICLVCCVTMSLLESTDTLEWWKLTAG